MSGTKKADEELEHARQMIALMKLEIAGEPEKRERPDFFLRLAGGRKIGLEVTRALDPFRATGRGARNRMKQRVREGLASKGVVVWVNISASEGVFGVLNREPKTLIRDADAIVALAAGCGHELKGEWICWEWLDEEEDEDPPEWQEPREMDSNTRDLGPTGVTHVERVMVHRSDELHVTWSSSHIGANGASLVQTAIDKKIAKLGDYKLADADEHWLLVVGSTGTGGSIEIDEVAGREFVSPFARTIFLERFGSHCLELRTRT
jgi:hypothetical protein